MTDMHFKYSNANEFHAVWGDCDPGYNKLIYLTIVAAGSPAVDLVVYQPRREVNAFIRIDGALSEMTRDWINDMLEWSK